MTPHPTPFEVHESGNLLHGTKANLAVGDVLVAGRPSNFDAGRVMNHVYVAATLDAAVWGAELAVASCLIPQAAVSAVAPKETPR